MIVGVLECLFLVFLVILSVGGGGSGGGGRGKKRDDKKQSKTAYNDENTFKRNGGRVKFGKDNSLLGQIYNGS